MDLFNMSSKSFDIKILNRNEEFIGFLHPHLVDITETNELGKLRRIKITHPLFDTNYKEYNTYNTLLSEGNKVWIEETSDGNSCLYVILEKTVSTNSNLIIVTAEEIIVELTYLPPLTIYHDHVLSPGGNKIYQRVKKRPPHRKIPNNPNHQIKITTQFLHSIYNQWFTVREVKKDKSFLFEGMIGYMGLLRLIEEQRGWEFEFQYTLNKEGHIIRYMDFKGRKGKSIGYPLRLDYDLTDLEVNESEADVAIAAAPIIKNNDITKIARLLKKFRAFHIKKGYSLAMPKRKGKGKAPYTKKKGSILVQTDPKNVKYKDIKGKKGSLPRTVLVEVSSDNVKDIYWELVKHLNQKKEPEFKINSHIIDLNRIQDINTAFLCVGDRVSVQMPGHAHYVHARVMRTTKNLREFEQDQIELGNYQKTIINEYIHKYTPRPVEYNTFKDGELEEELKEDLQPTELGIDSADSIDDGIKEIDLPENADLEDIRDTDEVLVENVITEEENMTEEPVTETIETPTGSTGSEGQKTVMVETKGNIEVLVGENPKIEIKEETVQPKIIETKDKPKPPEEACKGTKIGSSPFITYKDYI